MLRPGRETPLHLAAKGGHTGGMQQAGGKMVGVGARACKRQALGPSPPCVLQPNCSCLRRLDTALAV